jgi:two-component system, response regulator FlrC
LDSAARAVLLQYPWPGNVRELDNVMQRALILQPGATIYGQDLGLTSVQQFSEKPSLMSVVEPQVGLGTPAPVAHHTTQVPASTEPFHGDFAAAVSEHTSFNLASQLAGESAAKHLQDEAGVLGDDLKQREFEIIVSALRQERGSKKNTAERLGISARTLRYKIARLKESGLDISLAY